MINFRKLAGGVAFVAMSAALAPSAFAQVTSSGIQGSVSNADGTPATDATVTIEDSRTGLTRSVVTTSSGSFDVRGLNVGGPYTVTVTAPDQQSTQVTGVFLNLGAATDVNLAFSGETAGDVIVVTAAQAGASAIATGPASVFGLEDLENRPAINRDIKDIIRSDPRISLTRRGTKLERRAVRRREPALQLADRRRRAPRPTTSASTPTAIRPSASRSRTTRSSQVSVELAPFDVQYGGFTACNINAVTKSGGNEFHGGAFFDYTDDSLLRRQHRRHHAQPRLVRREALRRSTSAVRSSPTPCSSSRRTRSWKAPTIFGTRPVDSGVGTPHAGPVRRDHQHRREPVWLRRRRRSPTSKAVEDEKFFAKIDWTINDRHRAAFTYTYNDGFNFRRRTTRNNAVSKLATTSTSVARS